MEYAAWVQAVGSVLAIIVAGKTVSLTTKQARLERLYGVDGIFLFCAATVRDAAQKVQDGLLRPDDLQLFPIHRLNDCQTMLASVTATVLELGSEKLPQMASDASELVRSSINAVNASKMAIGVTNDLAANAIHLNDNATQLEALRATVLGFVKAQEQRRNRWWMPFTS